MYLFTVSTFIAGIAGFRFFNQHDIILSHKDGVLIHEIVETTYYDCGAHYSVYHTRKGIANIPIRWTSICKNGGIKCQKCQK
jgi:hypothetical protein